MRSNPVLLELSRGNIPREMGIIALTRVTRVARGLVGTAPWPYLTETACFSIVFEYGNACYKSIRVGQGQGQTDVFCSGDIATEAGNYPGLWGKHMNGSS